jgi:ketosteroid isomerase-like protein
MSQVSGQVVRRPLAVREQSSRTLEERLAIRFPRLFDAFIRRVSRFPPTSRVRQAAVAQSVRSAIEAFNRRDLEAMLTRYHREAKYEVMQGMAELGVIESTLPVREALARLWGDAGLAWGGLRIDEAEVVDPGDYVVMLAKAGGRGMGSGVPVSFSYATVSTVRDGKVIRTRACSDHAEALEAVGLRE